MSFRPPSPSANRDFTAVAIRSRIVFYYTTIIIILSLYNIVTSNTHLNLYDVLPPYLHPCIVNDPVQKFTQNTALLTYTIRCKRLGIDSTLVLFQTSATTRSRGLYALTSRFGTFRKDASLIRLGDSLGRSIRRLNVRRVRGL